MSARSPELSDDWVPGQVLVGKYQILERIGAGGMGVVHAARRMSLGDIVAIKSILPDRSNSRNRARFLREARAVARIRHPNVVQVFDFGATEDGRPFMVMEYVDGPTLATLLAAAPIPLERALELFADVCKAVEAGHRRGVVHRDLKPGNVMLDRSDDGTEIVKVLDFGLARVAEDPDDAERSRTGALVGTCAYMSPESIEQGASGSSGDLFSLGVMLYEIVTGALPFWGTNAIATIMQICEGSYRPAKELVPDLPQAVSDAIDAALDRSVAARPASAIELAAMALGRGPLTSSTSLIGWSPGLARDGDGQPARARRRLHTHVRSTPAHDQVRRPAPPSPDSHDPGPNLEQRSYRSGLPESAIKTLDGAGPRDGVEFQGRGGTRDDATLVWDSDDSQRDPSRVRAMLASPPFVGRKLELDTLLELLGAGGAEVPITVVLGDRGMGRTRLLRRFAELARDQQDTAPLVYEGRFWGYDGERAPAGETFSRMLDDEDDPVDPADSIAKGIDRRSGFAALAKRFEAQARGRPLVLILDDLHHAPRRDLEFLTYLVRGGPRAQPVVIVASAHTDPARSDAGTELSRWLLQLAGLQARTTLRLSPMAEEQLRAWLEATFGRLRIRPRDLRRIERTSAGNPYFLSELVRHLVVSDVIHQAPGEPGWVCEHLARDLLPEGLASAVADQLASLAEPLLELLETAAVIGEQFRFEVLARTMGVAEDQLDALVDDAVARNLLTEAQQEAGADLRFRSATVAQVLYDRLGNRRRKRVHKAVVQALLELDGSERNVRALAAHYRAIADWPKTLHFGLYAAREALERHDHDAAEIALEHAGAAIQALEASGQAAPSVVEQLRVKALTGALDARLGRSSEGVARLLEARSLLDHRIHDQSHQQEHGNARPLPYLRFEIALSLARCHLNLGQLDKAAVIGREAFELGLALTSTQAGGDDRRLEAEWDARVALAHTLGRFGDWTGAIEILEPVVQATPRPRLRVLHALGLRERGWLAARSGDLAGADRYAAQARAEAKASAEPLADYCAASVSAIAHASRGESRLAVREYRKALRGARALSLRRREMIEQANLCLSLADLGKHDEALQNMLSVHAICRELGDVASAADARVGLGRILRARGDIDEAIESFRRGHEACEAVGRHEYAAIALLELGRCELDRGQAQAAQTTLNVARERFAELRSLHQWEVELALAQAARDLGDEPQALARASAAQALLEHRRSDAAGTNILDQVDRGLVQVRGFIRRT